MKRVCWGWKANWPTNLKWVVGESLRLSWGLCCLHKMSNTFHALKAGAVLNMLKHWETSFISVKLWSTSRLLIWKDPDAEKDWGQKEKGDDRGWDGWMASLTRWMWALGVGDGQGGLACCSSRGHKESDMTERLNWAEPDYVSWWKIHWGWRSKWWGRCPALLYIPAPTIQYRRWERGAPTPQMKKFFRESFEELNLYLLEFGGTQER